MRKFIFILLLLSASILVSCDKFNGTAIVVNKEFVPEHTETFVRQKIMPHEISVGVGQFTQVTRYVKDEYKLQVKDSIGEIHNLHVSKDTFDIISINDTVCIVNGKLASFY